MTKDSRTYYQRWAEDVRADFRRACARAAVFTYLPAEACNRSDRSLDGHEVALGHKDAA